MDYKILARWALGEDNRLIQNPTILVEGEKIVFVGPTKNAPPCNDVETIEVPKGLVVPPFLNAHTHLPETLIRGLCDDAALHEWLFDHVWQVEPAMTAIDAKIGALLGIAEMVQTGTVGFIDQYFYANEIAEAVSETGVKAFLSPSIFDGNPETKTIEAGFNRNKEIFDKWHGHGNRIFVGFGAHAPYTIPREWLTKIIDAAAERQTKVHIHLSETQKEVIDAKKEWGCSPIEYMDQLGGLPHSYAAHCVHTSAEDQELLVRHQTPVLSCPQCNLKIGSGIAPIPEYLSKGVRVCLGTDGSASNNNLDMLEEVRLTAILHNGVLRDPIAVPSTKALELGTKNAADLLPDKTYSGVLAAGKPADIAVVDLGTTNNTPVINPLSNWLFASHGNNVVLTISNGKILYRDGMFLTLDVEDLRLKAQKSIDAMMARADYIPKSER